MTIVIEIDDARFKDIRRIACVQLENYHFKTVEQIIANGTPLPKGHGDLIDRAKIYKAIPAEEDNCTGVGMTREEAIEFGEMWLEINEDSKNSNTYNFFQMTLKALKQESILDKIRAEINSPNRGTCDYFIVDKIEEIINKYKTESEE